MLTHKGLSLSLSNSYVVLASKKIVPGLLISKMNACRRSLVAVILAIVLMLSLGVNTSQARLYPHFSGFPSSKAFQHSQSEDGKTHSVKPVSESLRRIPASDPNPTQNK